MRNSVYLLAFLVPGLGCGTGVIDGGTTDATPPTVTSTTPADGATGVAASAAVAVVFSEAMDASTVNAISIHLDAGGSSIAASVTFDGPSETATLAPTAPLALGTVHTATVSAGVTDLAGNRMAAAHAWSFTTSGVADTTPPTVISTSPPDGATAVAVNTVATVTFSEPVQPGSATSALFYPDNGVAGAISVSGPSATFTPDSNLPTDTTITITMAAGVQDLAGNTSVGQTVWSFTTSSAGDTTPPTVVSTDPADGATDVLVTTAVTAQLSEAIDATSVTTSTFTISPGSGTVAVSGSTLTLTPVGDLSANTLHTVTLTTGIQDLAGNALASEYAWTFTTENIPSAVMTWEAPTTNEDSSPLDDLGGYVIQFGTTSRFDAGFVDYDTITDIGMPTCTPVGSVTECTHTVSGVFLPGNTYYFAVTAFDWSGNVSDFSNEASKSF